MNSYKWSLVAAVVAGVFTSIYLNVSSLQVFSRMDSANPWLFAGMAGVVGGGIYYFVERPRFQLLLLAVAMVLSWLFSGVLGVVALAFVLGGLGAFIVSLISGRKF